MNIKKNIKKTSKKYQKMDPTYAVLSNTIFVSSYFFLRSIIYNHSVSSISSYQNRLDQVYQLRIIALPMLVIYILITVMYYVIKRKLSLKTILFLDFIILFVIYYIILF
jgi:hypothetical protein